ncbi:MAG: aminotransferase class IV [Candidatus Eisenbacteria bacterium]
MPDQVLCRVHGPDGGRRVSCPADSLAEAARFEPAAGVYTVDRTYPGGKVVALDRHFDRLEGSARAEGMLLRVDRAALRTLLREMLDESGFDLARFRLSVAEDRPDEVRITMERFRPVPLEVRSKGVRCVRVGSHRYHPQSKTLGWMHGREALPESVYEGLLSSSAGEILEGLSSNFFAITADTLRTAGDEVLFGMARGVVLQIAPAIVAVALRAISWTRSPNVRSRS